jgi:hypothetical protein
LALKGGVSLLLFMSSHWFLNSKEYLRESKKIC